jgi:glycosidase
VPDWSDVIDLNYSRPELQDYMIGAMRFWVEKVGVDGFRCDVAGMVPLDFWNRARVELERVKPIFMLAEAEGPEFHRRAFDMTYGWSLYHLVEDIAQGRKTAGDVDRHLRDEIRRYPPDAYRLYFTSNHDENSWNGTVYERLGESAEVMAVLTATLEGMPLVYSGQEAGLDKRLEFFEKDLIEWKDHPLGDLYKTLLNLKKEHPALWNGAWGGKLERVPTSNDIDVFAFVRQRDRDKIFVVLNLSDREQQFTLKGRAFCGPCRDALSSRQVSLQQGMAMKMRPWGYGLYVF